MRDKTLVIAEAGVNHDGDIQKALALVDSAHKAGADVIKFQTFRAACVASSRASKAAYQQRATDAAESQLAMLKKLELPASAYAALKAHAEGLGFRFLSTPFDSASVALLADLELSLIKVGSGDLTNAPLLLELAKLKPELIVSTGMADLGEIEEALGVLAYGFADWPDPPGRQAFAAAWADPSARAAVQRRVTLLHCTTEYPCPAEDANLGAMATLHAAFGMPVGYSDHTDGLAAPLAAVALGARVIEKHLTLDRSAPGPDHAASLEPDRFAAMVHAIRAVERALGDGVKAPRPSELKNVTSARKSLVAACAIKAGETLSADHIAVKRPGDGRRPIDYWDLLGTKAIADKEIDEPL